jgi:hypothetical protein
LIRLSKLLWTSRPARVDLIHRTDRLPHARRRHAAQAGHRCYDGFSNVSIDWPLTGQERTEALGPEGRPQHSQRGAPGDALQRQWVDPRYSRGGQRPPRRAAT